MELKDLNEKYIQLEKKRAALKLELYGTTKLLDDLVDSAVKEGYNLDIDTGKWVKEEIKTESQTKQPDFSWLPEYSEIYEKWRNLNHNNPDPKLVKNLSERLKTLEPRVEAFEPESNEDWGNINLKAGVLYDIRCMKAYFLRCDY